MSSQSSGTTDPDQHDQRQPVTIPKYQPDVQIDAKEREERAANRWEKRSAIVAICMNVLLVLIGVVGTILILRQLGAMQQSNIETQRANLESEKLNRGMLAETIKSNDLTTSGMEESARQADASLTESRRQSEASLAESARQAAASLEIAQRSLEESRRSFEVAQRARLVVAGFDYPGDPYKATAYITNTGALPATEVRWDVWVTIAPASPWLEERLSKPLPVADRNIPGLGADLRSIIGSGQQLPVSQRYPHQSPRFTEIDEQGEERPATGLYFFAGRIEYLDGFGNNRVLTFCQFQDGTNWLPCVYYNQAD